MKEAAEYILIAIPFFFLLMGIEYLIGRFYHKNVYQLEDTITNLSIGIGSQIFGVFLKSFMLGLYTLVYNQCGFIRIENPLIAFLVGTIAFDFIFYWAHRWGHTINFFWGAHIVHHQSEEYNLSVALRQSWIHNLISFWMFLPIPLLGVDPLIFMGVSAFSSVYQFWIHTKTIGKLGPFEWIFNTPSAHRVHHATNNRYLDKNYGGVFIIWDRLFGTYEAEKEVPVYGITSPLKSWNPFWANLHFYSDLFKNWRPFSFIKKIKLFFWDGPSSLFWLKPTIKNKYMKTKISLLSKVYIVFQFVLLLAGLLLFLVFFDEISIAYKFIFPLLLFWTMLSIGALMEGEKWAYWLEAPRLLSIGASMNILYYIKYVDWFNFFLIVSILTTLGIIVWSIVLLKKEIYRVSLS